MLNRYYQQELSTLRELGAEFAEAHPAIASMLSGPTADPDVERLLEGVAFLTGMIRQKLDDEFPEVIHDLIQLIWPHYLRPVPASSIVAFTPKPSLKQNVRVPAGTQLASVPIEGTTCRFRTCYEVEVQPLELLDVSFIEPPGKAPAIRLRFELKGIPLHSWRPKKLRLHLAGDYASASDHYFLLRHHTRRIILQADGTTPCTLLPEHLHPVGLSADSGVIPYPGQSFPGYRIIQEYFSIPQKFLFLDITGWEQWFSRGEGNVFELLFELDELPFGAPKIKRKDIVLFATPVINLFEHEADPIRLDHQRTEYRVRPATSNVNHYQIYSVDRVVGFQHGTAQARDYSPFDHFSKSISSRPVYHISQRNSPARPGSDFYLSVSYPPETGPPIKETLSIGLTCTNGNLPEKIQIGDISIPTSSTPEFIEFANLTTPTLNIHAPLGSNLLWRLLSHMSLNYVSLADTKNLKALLGLYLFPDTNDRTALLANRKRISGLESVESRGADRIISGLMMRGREIVVNARHDHFAGQGDLYIFGNVLNAFFSVYSTINGFTRFVLKETSKGHIIKWPAQMGDRPLI